MKFDNGDMKIYRKTSDLFKILQKCTVFHMKTLARFIAAGDTNSP
jgi:hypothetical protein